MSLEHKHAILDALMMSMDEDTAHDVIEHRRKKKCDLTLRAAKALAREFAKVTDVEKAVDKMVINGWRGFEAEWVPELLKPLARAQTTPEFEALWKAYPIRDAEDHAGALVAFEAVPAEDRLFVIQAAGWLKQTLPASYEPTYAEKRRFIPALRTWLSERRYESKRQFWEASQRRAAQG